MQDFDVVGEEDMVLGAPLAIRGGRPGMQQPQQRMMANMAVRQPGWMHGTPQGVSLPAEEMDVLPFDAFRETAAAAGAFTNRPLVSFPQRPFRGERLVMTAFFISAAGVVTDVSGLVVVTPAIFVGAVQVGANQGQMPVSAFSGTAFGVRMSWPRAGQGTRVSIPIDNSAVVAAAAGDQLIVTAVCFGRAVR